MLQKRTRLKVPDWRPVANNRSVGAKLQDPNSVKQDKHHGQGGIGSSSHTDAQLAVVEPAQLSGVEPGGVPGVVSPKRSEPGAVSQEPVGLGALS